LLLACTFLSSILQARAESELQLTLSDGFLSEEVIVSCDGQVLSKSIVTTKVVSSIADYLTVKPKTTQPVIEIELPRLNLKTRYAIDLSKTQYLEISLNHGRLIWRPTNALIPLPGAK